MKDVSENEILRRERLKEMESRLDKISEEILRDFGTDCRFHHFHILADDQLRLHVCIIFKRDKDLEGYKRNAKGVQQRLNDFMYTELERRGVGRKSDIAVEFELDSDEAMKRKVRESIANIPSGEDFARAHKLSAEESRNLDKVSENVKRHYKEICPFHDVYLFPERGNFRACVFFKEDKDLESCMRSGITQEMEDFIYTELERAGRGAKGKIAVAFEFDSDERVNAEFDGNYYGCRLRAGAQPKFGKFGGEVLVL